jgi:hypothetical protein
VQGGEFEIEYPGKYAGIKLIDVLGKEVYYVDFKPGQTQAISASFLPGVYFVLILDDSKNCLSKSRLVIKP